MANSNKADIRNVPIRRIKVNPKNPRIVFDQEKMDELIASIKERDVLVPLNVYIDKKTKEFIIIDGERRYLATLELALPTLPVIVTKRPNEADYIKDMFHIHHMREPWELVPTALELRRVIELETKKNGKKPTEKTLSTITGLSLSEIRRCNTVLSFPHKIQDLMLKEEEKTKQERSEIGKDKILTEDFFIEITKNVINPLENYNETAFKKAGGKNKIYDLLVDKRRGGYIKNIVSLRPISKYIRDHPVKAGNEIKKFILEEKYTSDKLIEKSNLDFNLYNFRRNVNVFLGALANIPKRLKEEQKEEVLKTLRKTKNEIDGKINDLLK